MRPCLTARREAVEMTNANQGLMTMADTRVIVTEIEETAMDTDLAEEVAIEVIVVEIEKADPQDMVIVKEMNLSMNLSAILVTGIQFLNLQLRHLVMMQLPSPARNAVVLSEAEVDLLDPNQLAQVVQN